MTTTPETDQVVRDFDQMVGGPLLTGTIEATCATGANRATMVLEALRGFELRLFVDPSPEVRAIAAKVGAEAWSASWAEVRAARARVLAELRRIAPHLRQAWP